MRRRKYILSGIAALYFGTVIGLAFLPASPLNGSFWCWAVLAFLPVGTLLLLLMGRRRWWAAIAFGMLGAAWLEAAQSVWMPAGYADAVDVVWGSTGVAAGVLVAFLATAPRRQSVRIPRRIESQTGNREVPQD